MDLDFWYQVVSQLDPRDRRLREGLTQPRLDRLEESLGLRLPEGYRSFLQAHDGGWIGDQQIYGSPEIIRLLELGRDRFQEDPIGATWTSFGIDYVRLLPIHPSSTQSVECLSLDESDTQEEETAIYWVSFHGCRKGIETESLCGVRSLDIDVLTWSRALQCHPVWRGEREHPQDPEVEPTYVDFLDWTLDAVLVADARRPDSVGAGSWLDPLR